MNENRTKNLKRNEWEEGRGKSEEPIGVGDQERLDGTRFAKRLTISWKTEVTVLARHSAYVGKIRYLMFCASLML